MKKILVGVAVLIAFVAVGIAVYTFRHTSTVSAQKLQTVTLALDWTPNTDHTGIYVALKKGWYKAHGIDLKILPFSADVSAVTIIKSKKADVGIGSMEDIVGNAAKHDPIISIGAVLQHNTSGFIALADNGITSPKDFDGKVYGGYGSPFEDAVVKEVAQKDGGKGNFKDVVLSVDAMQALESKRIDFVWVLAGWELIQAKRDGYKTNFFQLTNYGIPDSPTLAFVVTPEKIKQDPEMLKKFMAATAEGYEYARLHPKESAQILLDSAPAGTFPDKGLVFDSQKYLSTQYADKGRKWGLQDSQMWHGYPQFMLDSGSITDEKNNVVKTLNFDGLYTNEFLPK